MRISGRGLKILVIGVFLFFVILNPTLLALLTRILSVVVKVIVFWLKPTGADDLIWLFLIFGFLFWWYLRETRQDKRKNSEKRKRSEPAKRIPVPDEILELDDTIDFDHRDKSSHS
jgi:hypothetical protein